MNLDQFLGYANQAIKPKSDPEIKSTKQDIDPQKINISLEKYSDRSFAIFGDTKPIKDKLQILGGKFNNRLRRDGRSVPGWIFSINRLASVKDALKL